VSSSTSTAPVDLGSAIVAAAQAELGKPYLYGAEGPNAFDCSGLVQDVFNSVGLKVPRVSSEQYGAGVQIAYADLAPGDLVFSEWPGDDVPHHGHVAIYAGNGQIIEAPHPGGVVQQVALDQNYLSHVDGYTRVTGSGDSSGSAVTTGLSIPNPLDPTGILGTILGGLSGDATGISSFVGDLYGALVSTINFFTAFFRPSTYIRIAAGFFGLIFLVIGLVFLGREAKGSAA
jgi:hypothetical protein